ncbi:class I SAM-dependent DNA methyltransferase [Arsukibacterium sp.]|uniref:class I SAM-dependent DNA methyltransferase n=1 Tax=Arsukibacterium sp. TaxID=1977258 RepID=UPI002FD9D924
MQLSNALYTDLSIYYDLMCCDINYQAQSLGVQRLHQLFGNGGKQYLDLACGSGPHIRHFIDAGYQCQGLDLNQPMLTLAQARCPEAGFMLADMGHFNLAQPVDLISCFLYSVHYNPNLSALSQCFARVHASLTRGGIFVFNAVDKHKISNLSSVSHSTSHLGSLFEFASAWHYNGQGEQQSLRLRIRKTTGSEQQLWQDEHPMVAVDFTQLQSLLAPYFEVHMLTHDYQSIMPWDALSGNALFVCIKA